MATLPRSAKSSSAWTTNDLLAYNITVSSQSPETFYSEPLPDIANLATFYDIDPNLLSGTLGTQGLSNETYCLLEYLDLASRPNSDQESAVHDFAREILRALRYELRGSLLRSRHTIPLLISGDPNRSAPTSVCLIQGRSGIILIPVIQEDTPVDPEPKVIASAIATFQYNSRLRARLGKEKLGFYEYSMHHDVRHSTHLLRSPRHSRIERSGSYRAISGLHHTGQEMHCSIEQLSSQRGYGEPRFSTSRSPALCLLSPFRQNPLGELYSST